MSSRPLAEDPRREDEHEQERQPAREAVRVLHHGLEHRRARNDLAVAEGPMAAATRTGTGGSDGSALFASDHPFSPTDATTQSNTDTSSLSATSIEATRRTSRTSIFNDRGELSEVNYDLILCTVFNEEKAWEIINSAGKVDTDNNNRNFHQGRWKLAVWDRLTSTYSWFQMDMRLANQFLIWWDRVGVEFNFDRDFDTYVAKWSVYYRSNPDFYDWRWGFGHNATS